MPQGANRTGFQLRAPEGGGSMVNAFVTCNDVSARILQESTHTRNGPSATNPRLDRLRSSLAGPYPTTG